MDQERKIKFFDQAIIINLMIEIDEQKATQQFQKEYQKKQKLRQLQDAVFKNYTIKRSVSVMHNKTPSPSQSPMKKTSQFFIPSIKTERQSQSFPAVTVITFGKARQKPVSQSARTLSLFHPRVILQTNDRRLHKQEKLLESIKKLEQGDLKKSHEAKSKVYEMRDSQTLLRKNSLFLVSCLKTRYKERKNVHIGERPEAANHMKLANFSQKVPINTQYQHRFEYMEEAKQRLLQTKMKKQDSTRFSRLSPLLPEPWETDFKSN